MGLCFHSFLISTFQDLIVIHDGPFEKYIKDQFCQWVFVASQLSTHNYGERAKTGWLSGAMCEKTIQLNFPISIRSVKYYNSLCLKYFDKTCLN
jgi:hypothetical protein